MPSDLRVAIGFTSRGVRGKAIGECWDNRCSDDGHFEIFIGPELAHAADAMSTHIAAVLPYELVHAAVVIPAEYGMAFKRVAVRLGLVGRMTATTPSDTFLFAVAPNLAGAGPLPHSSLETRGDTKRPKKQAARLLKCEGEAGRTT